MGVFDGCQKFSCGKKNVGKSQISLSMNLLTSGFFYVIII